MAAITAEYPISADPIMRGDPLTIAVPILTDGTYEIPAGWTFASHVRRWPDGELVAEFTITEGTVEIPVSGVDTTVPCLLLTLTGAETARLHYGDGFDLEQTAPVTRTLWVVHSLRIEKDYTYTGESST